MSEHEIFELCQKPSGISLQEPKVGDKVVISKDSDYYPYQMRSADWQIGTLYWVGETGGMRFAVRWPNKYQNSYTQKDLVFLQQAPQSNSEGRFLLRT